MAKTHRSALELTETGASPSGGTHGLYLPTANLTDVDTSGQLSYAEGSGVVSKSPITIVNSDAVPVFKVLATTGSSLLNGVLMSALSTDPTADFSLGITVGASAYVIPLFAY